MVASAVGSCLLLRATPPRVPVGEDQANYGNVAFSGGTQVPMDPTILNPMTTR